MVADDRQKAIAIIISSRNSHVTWLEFQESTPDWADHTESDAVGGPEHHRRCIVEYDFVLEVLIHDDDFIHPDPQEAADAG